MGSTVLVGRPSWERRRSGESRPDRDPAGSPIVEHGGDRARVEGVVSGGTTRRVLQMAGNGAEVEVEIRNFAGTGRPVLLGITER